MDIMREIVKDQLKTDVVPFSIGDTVKVNVKVVEGNRERIQAFEGIVIARQNSGINETFTVRKIAYGVGVERCFPIHSPACRFTHRSAAAIISAALAIFCTASSLIRQASGRILFRILFLAYSSEAFVLS